MTDTRRFNAADRTVLVSRIVSFGLGPLTVLAVGTFLSPQSQGYYYSFNSVLAASTLFEAGIATALVQIAAHEAAHLGAGLDRLGSREPGEGRRLAAVLKFAVGWYWSVAGIMGAAIGIGGWILFSSQPADVEWATPWIILVLVASLDFALQPFFVLLEGTGQVARVYRYRIIRSILQNGTLILSVGLGLGLLALPLGAAVALLVGVANLLPVRKMFISLRRRESRGAIRWRTEILPFQWRIAVSWMCGYFSASLFTPLLLATQGPEVAGQMGMTLLLTSACTGLAASVMVARAPGLGSLASAREWTELGRLFKVKARQSILIAAALLTAGVGFVAIAQYVGIPLATRVLPWWQFGLLAVGILAYHVEGVLAFYMRAQKREPYFLLELVGAIAIVPASVWLSSVAGAFGVAAVFALIHAGVMLPVAVAILRRSMRHNSMKVRAIAPGV